MQSLEQSLLPLEVQEGIDSRNEPTSTQTPLQAS